MGFKSINVEDAVEEIVKSINKINTNTFNE